ncbi:MAG: twin-arginine translocase TatA/TatE family subunit [Bacteroidetes bacterium]|nr:twin-arginine translocase TatA/TatE family subunit [Bacteroidota bacterium]
MSSGEIIIILFVYLLFFGAKGIPSLAQTMGKAVYQFRNAAKDVQDEIMKGAQDIQKEVRVPLDQMDVDNRAVPRRETPIAGPSTEIETEGETRSKEEPSSSSANPST